MGKTVGTLQLLIGCCKTTSESDCCQNDTDDISKLPAPPPHQLKEYGYKELADVTGGFSRDYLLGEGGFGEVYEATLDGEKVAIKKLKIVKLENKLEESEFLTCVNHPNIVKMIGLCREGSNRVLVLEFVPNKTLTYHLHDEKNKTLDWPTRMKIALESANGLLYLHQDRKIIHRDMKADNILLDNNFNAKVADFSLSNFFPDSDNVGHITSIYRGTNVYADTEFGDKQKVCCALDVYAFGVILLELISGRKPTQNNTTIIEWAKSRIGRVLNDNDCKSLVDPKLKDYNKEEMMRMIHCAAASVYKLSSFRPKIKQIIEVLEGNKLAKEIMDRQDIFALLGQTPQNVEIKEYDFRQLAMATNYFSNANLLGEGAFGQTYIATLDGENVVIKRLKRTSSENTLQEMNYLGFARHPNLVKVIGHCSDGSNRLLVLEFVPNNALTYHLYETPKSLDWSERMKIAIHSAKGLEYLHDHCTPQIIHGNLTPNNIFVDNNFEPKMADFGLSIFFTDDNITHIKSDRRAQIYVDFSYKHENDRRGGSEKADVYSFGVILLELITGRGRSVDQRRTILRWSKDRIGQALDNSEFTDLVDSRLQEYDLDEMLRMISCAAASVYKSSRFRPKMKQIVQVLEGSMPWSIVWRENDKTFLTE
ncbi:proline-rich receptor-like protein kinase PERK1 isoform X1 [Manihot esculenta]|uniref:Uncharacterized protein n=1 Tax=Manihot esculenta TaxID=3983 RepID=A0ACB7HZW8_MANES|nr:proline-rich receptor-like protein kinase PERK1 isoform X1 [Manihot esculenta]KAG8656366.1 hypothetical protein MANES_04G126576v8 [Manihot esculenta]